jgi:hypothetical protein
MRPLVVYLNELSSQCEGLGLDEIRLHVGRAVDAINQLARTREDALLRMQFRLREITIGPEQHSIGAVLVDRKERFTRFKRVLDKAPFGEMPVPSPEVLFDDRLGIALSWAHFDQSFILSFGHCDPWENRAVNSVLCMPDISGAFSSTPITVRNIATVEHLVIWETEIREYGNDLARSSIIYRGYEFVLRMHFDDHPPAHIHIYPRPSDTSNLIAKVRIDNNDVLEGYMPSRIRRDVLSILDRHRESLMLSWQRVRSGEPPFLISDE